MRHCKFFDMEEQRKDLSLIDLLVVCWKFLVKVFMFFVDCAAWCLRMLWQRKWVMLVCVLVGLALSISDYFLTNQSKAVKAGFAVNTFSKKPYFSIEEIRNLDMDEFAEFAGLTEEQKDAIISIEPYYVIDLNDDATIELIDYKEEYKMEVDDEKAEERNFNVWATKVFYVEVNVTDKDVVPVFRQALMDYLNASPVMQTAWETNKIYVQGCITALESELRKIDSLQNIALQKEEAGSGFIETRRGATSTYGSGTFIQVLSWDKNRINEMIYEHQLTMNDLNEGPIFYNTPITYYSNPRASLQWQIMVGIFQGLVLGYAMVLLIIHWKKISAFFNKK